MNLKVVYRGSNSRRVIRRYRTQLVVLISLLAIGIGPIIADQLTSSDPQAEANETQTVTASVSPSPMEEVSPAPSPSNTSQEDSVAQTESATQQSDSVTVTASPSPSKLPPHAIENQDMLIQIPRVQRVDPRATQIRLPQVSFYPKASMYVMLCMSSSKGIIDIQTKGINDSFQSKNLFVNGDRSQGLQISGSAGQVLGIFNGFGGLKLTSFDGKSIVGTLLYMRFVAISEPTDNFALCGSTQTATQWSLEIQPLGLQVNTKKNPLNLGDKTKKP